MGNSGEEQPKRRSVAGVACVYVTPAELPGVAWSADGQRGASARAVGLRNSPQRACAAHRQRCRVWRGVLMANVGPQHGLWGCAIARNVRVRHTGRAVGCGVQC
jgi:hypothetical protein